MAKYYAERAAAGLILSEATSVTPQGVGYADTPGIWSDEQVEGWKLVTKAVHDAGGTDLPAAVARRPHVGSGVSRRRTAGRAERHRAAGHVSLVRPKREFVTPRALELDEIPGIVAAYRKGAENAKRAGFDGVEVHGANGYLLDQFLQDSTNKRTDAYGGPIENRARLMLEVTDACIDVWGADRVGMHLAPRARLAHDGRQRSAPQPSATSPANSASARSRSSRRANTLGDGPPRPATEEGVRRRRISRTRSSRRKARRRRSTRRSRRGGLGSAVHRESGSRAPLRSRCAAEQAGRVDVLRAGAEGYTDYPMLETAD